MVNSVLVFRIGSIGDTIVALPALWYLRNGYQSASITMLTNFPVSSSGKECPLSTVLGGTDIVAEYIEYPPKSLRLSELLQLRARIRAVLPDVLVYLMPPRSLHQLARDWLFFRLCGIKKIVGLCFSRDAQSRLYDSVTGLWEHESHRLGRLISKAGEIDYADATAWSLRFSTDERQSAEQALMVLGGSPFIALSVGTKAEANDWGDNRWQELFSRLANRCPTDALVLIGSNDEYERCERIGQEWRAPVLNLCGKLKPRISAAVLERAKLFVGHDSGPMHLAAAVGTTVVAIFSARNRPGEWYPSGKQHKVLYNKTECFGCKLTTCVVEAKKCIRGITVDSVFHEICNVLVYGNTRVARDLQSTAVASCDTKGKCYSVHDPRMKVDNA